MKLRNLLKSIFTTKPATSIDAMVAGFDALKANTQKEAEGKPYEPIDDWGPMTGQWEEGWFCHCGFQSPYKDSLCRQCGHKDSFESKVFRKTEEISPSRIEYAQKHDALWSEYWRRNPTREFWTEAHCTHSKEQQ